VVCYISSRCGVDVDSAYQKTIERSVHAQNKVKTIISTV